MNAQDYMAAAGARIAKVIQAEAVELKARHGLTISKVVAEVVDNNPQAAAGDRGPDLDLRVDCQATVSAGRRYHASHVGGGQ